MEVRLKGFPVRLADASQPGGEPHLGPALVKPSPTGSSLEVFLSCSGFHQTIE
jgi:hypothetical protein